MLRYIFTILDKTVSAPQIAKENKREKTNTTNTRFCNSALGVQEKLFLSSSYEFIM